MENHWPIVDAFGNILAYRGVHNQIVMNPRFTSLHKPTSIYGSPYWFPWGKTMWNTVQIHVMNMFYFRGNR